MFISLLIYIFILWIILLFLLVFTAIESPKLTFFIDFIQQKMLMTILTMFLIIILYNYCVIYALIQTNVVLENKISPFSTINFYFPFIFIFLLITLLTLYFCFAYNKSELFSFIFFVVIIFIAGSGLFSTTSLFFFFCFYEMLLLPSFFILYNFAKTRKAVEAAYLMFFWTQFGALALIFNFQYLFFISSSVYFSAMQYLTLTSFEQNFLFITLLVGFGVKFPIWPFYDWLPKAHVEASTNFSIFLSGVLVKFALFGFMRYLYILGLEPNSILLYPFIFIGLIDASSKIYYQIDLKKLIAYATVVEMHWLLLALISGQSVLWLSGFAMLISHALLSSNFFFLVDAITRRFKSRLITEVTGLFYLVPNLYFILLTLLVVFLGFPGTLFFVAEFLFFSFLLDLNFFLFIILIFLLYFYVPTCFFKNWFFIMFGYSKYFMQNCHVVDLDLKEIILFWFFIALIFWLGFTFQFFF